MTTPDTDPHDDGPRPIDGKCNGPLRQRPGDLCTQTAGWGTDHPGTGRCKLHGGSLLTHRKKAQRERLRQAAEAFGLPRTIDPATAILEALHKAAGQLDFFEAEVAELVTPWVEQPAPGGGVRIDEHPAVTAYRQALDRLFAFGERTLKLGLAERQVAVSELTAGVLARVVMALLDSPELGLSREQRELGRRLAGQQLRELVQSGGDAA